MSKYLQRPPSEQGDGDQDNLKIVLADNTPPARSTKLQVIEPPHRTERSDRAQRRSRREREDYAVQVGEFRSKAEARRQIAFVQDRFGKHLGDADGAAEHAGRRYRTVFSGLSQAEAHATCRAMRAKGLACEVMDD